MKYLKLTAAVLAVSILTCGISVFATTKEYNNLTLKIMSLATELGPATKQHEGTAQGYRNFGTVNNCTSDYDLVSVRVYSQANKYSDWMVVSNGATSYWKKDNKTKHADAYKLFIKNAGKSVCTDTHFGDWYLD